MTLSLVILICIFFFAIMNCSLEINLSMTLLCLPMEWSTLVIPELAEVRVIICYFYLDFINDIFVKLTGNTRKDPYVILYFED